MPTPSLLETKWQIARRWAAEARQQQASHVRQARLALGFAVAAAVSGAIATAIGVDGKESSSFSLSGLFALMDLSRIYAAPITRLGCLAFEGQGAFASQS
jgi:hypothetical protein